MMSIWINLNRYIILHLLLVLMACSHISNEFSIDNQALEQLQLTNFHSPEQGLISSGQPSQQQLQTLANLGIKHVINLRPMDEQSFDEQALVSSLGMSYHNIPVNGIPGITFENAEKLAQILKQIDGEPALLHCSSGNRVGALIALQASKTEDTEAAIAKGKNWGLTHLENVVREKLAN